MHKNVIKRPCKCIEHKQTTRKTKKKHKPKTQNTKQKPTKPKQKKGKQKNPPNKNEYLRYKDTKKQRKKQINSKTQSLTNS